MNNPNVKLDEGARRLFEELGGIEARKDFGSNGISQGLVEEQLAQDRWRIRLVRLAYLLGTRFFNIDGFRNKQDYPEVFTRLTGTIKELSKLPGESKHALFRFRGAPEDSSAPEQYDYEILYSNFKVDNGIVQSMVKRSDGKNSKLTDQLNAAFTEFSRWGLNSLHLQVADNDSSMARMWHVCLRVLMQYQRALNQKKTVVLSHNGKKRIIPIVNNEHGHPDINLTMVAAVNMMSPEAIQGLVTKVKNWMAHQKRSGAGCSYTSVYNAMFDIEKISSRLKQPPFEINNIKWLMVSGADEWVSDEKAEVARLVMGSQGASPQKVAKVISSVYGDDYRRINSRKLSERITLSSELLSSIDGEKKNSNLRKEVLQNIHKRLDTVDDSVFDNIYVRPENADIHEEDTADDINDKEKGTMIERVHKHLFKMITFFKGRSVTHKKMKSVIARPMEFTDKDYDTIATDFRISQEEARELVGILKSCFSSDSRFKKRVFINAVEHFIKYEKKIFEFLWHHMKDVILNEDRTAFLNALQTLASRMNQPKKAFKILLEDFCRDPSTVNFSDNKAMMLSNLIVHKYEALADIEMTPEDIILDRLRLDETVAKYASWRIDKDQEKFFEKVRTIHLKLSEALELGKTRIQGVDDRNLLSLERELYIFLSLVAGNTSRCVLRSGVREYGNPESEIYELNESDRRMPLLIQNLRVVIHGLGSIGAQEDIGILKAVRQKEEELIHMKKDRNHRAQARMISEWVDQSIKLIRYQGASKAGI